MFNKSFKVMTMNFDHILDSVTEFMKNETNTKTVIGETFELGKFKCVPIIRVGLGFGTAGGEGDAKGNSVGHGEGGGGGAGLSINPIGFLVTMDDKISFIPSESSHGLSAAFEKVPDLIEKYWDTQNTKTEPLDV